MDVSEIIRGYRKEKKLTQSELAKKAGLALISLRRYETAERNITLYNLQKIADALEISLSDLLGQTIPKEENKMNEQNKTTDQEMRECFKQLFFKLSEASESSGCTADDLMTITKAMLAIYPMFRKLPDLFQTTPDVDLIAKGLGKQIKEQVTAVNSATHTV